MIGSRSGGLAMPRPAVATVWIVPVLVSVAGLAVVLTGSILTVSVLSARDAITLAGGIAVFAVSITAWLLFTVMLGRRSWHHWRRLVRDHEPAEGPTGRSSLGRP
jgi:Kef-type K+ transport system membrane component KefB